MPIKNKAMLITYSDSLAKNHQLVTVALHLMTTQLLIQLLVTGLTLKHWVKNTT